MEEVKEMWEKERVEVESTFPPSIYNAPPFDEAVQEVKVNKASVSFFDVEERVAEIAPPFSDEHNVNVTPEIVWVASMEVNSNTPPSPIVLLMFSNSFDSVSVNDPALTEISGVSYVEYVAVQVIDME